MAALSQHHPPTLLGQPIVRALPGTYGGKLIRRRVDHHLERFFQSAKALHIPSPLSKDEWAAVMEETVEANRHLLKAWGGDFWVFIRLTPGSKDFFGAGGEEEAAQPTMICECMRIPFASRAEKFRHGLEMVTVSTRRIPPECIPPRIKLHSYGPLTPLKNGGDHSCCGRLGPLGNRPTVFWCHVLESWRQGGQNSENTEEKRVKMGEI